MDPVVAAPTKPTCPHCGSNKAVRAGRRKLKSGNIRQLYRCDECHRRYSNLNRAGKHTPPEMILRALTLICEGYPYREALEVLRREFRQAPAKSALTRWTRDFPLPWLDIRDSMLRVGEPVVRSHLFTHAGLSYRYALHLPKCRFAKRFPDLLQYLQAIPTFLDHSLFERAAHCSQLNLVRNPGLRHCRDIGLTRLAAAGLSLAPSNPKRHSTLQTYFLYGDRNTLGVEVPVYYFDKSINRLIAGHIDFLQVRGDRILILDYKPDAASENPGKVATQLSLYANALSFRTRIPLSAIQCVYFDQKDAFFFDPTPIDPQRLSSGPILAPPAHEIEPLTAPSGFETYPSRSHAKKRF